MRNLRRAACLALAGALCLGLLAGCGGEEDAAEGVALRVGVVGALETADPAMAKDPGNESVLLHLGENLMRRTTDAAGAATASAGAAKSYRQEESLDGTVTYTFKLRSGARWSDGRRVTAGDFVYAWQRLAAPATGSPHHALLEMVQGYDAVRAGGDAAELAVDAKDDETLVVTLSSRCPFFLSEVCTASATLPLRQDVAEAEGWAEDWGGLVTNGVYQVDRAEADGLTAVRSSRYYDKNLLGPESIRFRFAADEAAAWTLYEAGETDFVSALPEEELAERAKSETWSAVPAAGTYAVLFNNGAAPLDDPLVRRALSLAIDRSALPALVGTGTEAATALVPAGMPQDGEADFRTAGGGLLSAGGESYESDCREARTLLEDSGYSGGDSFPALEYLYVAVGEAEAVARAVQEMWREALKVSVVLRPVTEEELETALATGSYTLAAARVTSPVGDAMGYLAPWGRTDGDNVLAYSNSAFNTLLSVIRSASDGAARLACLHDAEELLLDDAALAPLYVKGTDWALRPGLTGVFRDAVGRFYFGAVVEDSEV